MKEIKFIDYLKSIYGTCQLNSNGFYEKYSTKSKTRDVKILASNS